MSLRNVFEGQDDRMFRLEAGAKLAEFVEYTKQNPEVAHVGERQVSFKKRSVPVLPKELIVMFFFKPGAGPARGQFMPTHGGGAATILLDIQTDVNEPGFDPLQYVMTRASDYREAWIHEYMHFLDWKRIGYDSWKEMSSRQKKKAGPDDSYRSYVQDPVEQNAFFQQVADRITNEIPQEQVAVMDVNEFYRIFIEKMKELFDPNELYRQRQMPNLKKRVAQLYQDIIGSG